MSTSPVLLMLLFSVLSGEQLTICLTVIEGLQKHSGFYPPAKLSSCTSSS